MSPPAPYVDSELDPRKQLAALREQLEIEQAQAALDAYYAARRMPLRERFGDYVNDDADAPRSRSQRLTEEVGYGGIVDVSDYTYDDPNFGLGPFAGLFSLLSDRQYGKLFPYYQNEMDLMRIRGGVHRLRTLGGTTDGLQDSLANYVLGKGFKFVAQEAESAKNLSGDIDMLLSSVQRVLDEFIDEHGFDGTGFDREAHHRSREDGEAFVPLEWNPRRNRVEARFIECEQVTQPASTMDLDNWLGFSTQFPTNWSFGIHTSYRRTNQVHGYHVVYDGIQGDWNYFPDDDVPEAVQQDAKERGSGPAPRMQHIKRNVPANAKRGLSDYYSVAESIAGEIKLRRNMVSGASLQAAIAWILEPQLPGGAQAGAAGIGSDNIFAQYNRPIQPGGGLKTQNVNKYPPGTILKPSFGQKYLPGPMGAERNEGFTEVGQYVLRMTGMRWQFPEGMVSGDYSNNAFASAMMAESPFVKAREADQGFYKRHFYALMWKVLRMAWEYGRFNRFGISWESLEHLIDLKIDCPTVATRDALKMAQTAQLYKSLGVVSVPTIAAEAGYDHDAEVKQGAKPDDLTAPPASGALPGQLATDLKGQDPNKPAVGADGQEHDPSCPAHPANAGQQASGSQPGNQAQNQPNSPQNVGKQPGDKNAAASGKPAQQPPHRGPHKPGCPQYVSPQTTQERETEPPKPIAGLPAPGKLVVEGASKAALVEHIRNAGSVDEARALVIDALEAYP